MPIPTAIKEQTVELVAALQANTLAISEFHKQFMEHARHQSRQLETLIALGEVPKTIIPAEPVTPPSE
jgi:hypothetical protein